MAKIYSVIKWLLRAWPVLAPAILAGVHVAVSINCAIDLSDANKGISLSLQIVGGILILYSIDSNMGVVNKQSLFTMFGAWLRSFPLLRRSILLNAESGTIKITVHQPKIRVGGPGESMEEHINYLQQQIDWLKEDLNDEVKNLGELFRNVEEHSSKQISTIRESVGVVEHIDGPALSYTDKHAGKHSVGTGRLPWSRHVVKRRNIMGRLPRVSYKSPVFCKALVTVPALKP